VFARCKLSKVAQEANIAFERDYLFKKKGCLETIVKLKKNPFSF
jgi:hypothetical protein